MGKKSSDAPAPDPRLVEAQLRSMSVQEDAIGQVLAIAQKQQSANAELQPLQMEAARFGLEAQRTGYDQSQQDRTWMLGRRDALSGIQDQLIADAREFNSPAREAQMVATATADAGKSMSDLRQARDRELASMGVMPGSGRSASMDRLDEARITAGASNAARFGARQEGRMLVDRANNALAGYPAMASGATGQGATIGANGVSVANAGVGGINATYGQMTGAMQAAGGLAGQMGSNASGMYGTQANYKLAADREAGADLAGIGTVLGGAAKLYAASAREYKEDITRIGDHPRLPIGLYSFRYREEHRSKWGDATYIGVMADEVEKVRPGAVSKDEDGYTVVDYSQLH